MSRRYVCSPLQYNLLRTILDNEGPSGSGELFLTVGGFGGLSLRRDV